MKLTFFYHKHWPKGFLVRYSFRLKTLFSLGGKLSSIKILKRKGQIEKFWHIANFHLKVNKKDLSTFNWKITVYAYLFQKIKGWFPIYDTMHGIRGEIKIQAKVEIFNDCNEYRKSSCGVQFFCSNFLWIFWKKYWF